MEGYSLAGTFCVVTGGTKGIGRAVVEHFCELGAEVLTCSRKQENVDQCMSDWRAKGLKVHAMAADVSTSEGRQEFVRRAEQLAPGGIHVLVNNVGTNIRKPCESYADDDLRHLLSTNLESFFCLTRDCSALLKAGKGSVVFVSSVAGGPLSMGSGVIYAMTKAAMNQLTRNLAVEWGKHGVRVNAVAPWYIETDLANQVLKDEEFRKKVEAATPLGRVGVPQDVASVVAFLASPAAGYVSGQVLQVDGGYSVKGFWPQL